MKRWKDEKRSKESDVIKTVILTLYTIGRLQCWYWIVLEIYFFFVKYCFIVKQKNIFYTLYLSILFFSNIYILIKLEINQAMRNFKVFFPALYIYIYRERERDLCSYVECMFVWLYVCMFVFVYCVLCIVYGVLFVYSA